ncbi:MAG: DinB family protein [Meiothermus sp.]|nr:DinB family protein [Meiothermus sp.]
MSHAQRPDPSEHLPYFSRYVDLVPEGDIVQMMETEFARVLSRLSALTPAQARYRYAEGKWSVTEVVGHICDTERVFTYRALHAARRDPSPLPGFDQAQWAGEVDYASRDLPDVLNEWRTVRAASISLFGNLSAEAWSRRATVSGNALTPRACAYIIVGHVLHHLKGFENDYGVL